MSPVRHTQRARQAPVGQVRQDAQVGLPARPCRNLRRNLFGHGVDGIGAHGVARVHDEVGDHHGAAAGVDHPHLQVAEAAAQLDEDGVAGIAQRADVFLVLQDADACVLRVRHLCKLDLRNHLGARHGGNEAAVVITLARRVAHRGHHRRFFGGHGDQPVSAVDLHVGGNAHGDVHRADDVLDEVVGQFGRQVAGVQQVGLVVVAKARKLGHGVDACGNGELVKTADAAAGVCGGSHGSVWDKWVNKRLSATPSAGAGR